MNRQEIASTLTASGLPRGAIVLLHSSLCSIGKVDGGADAVIDGFLDAIGPEGSLMVPVFGALGIITETLRKRPGAQTSSCPVAALAGIGPAIPELFKDHWKPERAHCEDTPYMRLRDKGGYICLLGVDQDRNTSLHGIEAMLKLPYLRDYTHTFTTPEGEKITKTWKYFPGPHRNFMALDKEFLARGAMTIGHLGNAQLRIIDAGKMWEIATQCGMADPAFVLCDNPNCPDCVRQRADIFADRIANQEKFKLSISSRLAGRYIPEMIEKSKACGLNLVELDYIQGMPAADMSAEALKRAVDEFKENGIGISALRLAATPDSTEKLAVAAAGAAIDTLILPASASTVAIQTLVDAKFTVLLYNKCMTARATVEATRAANCGICFNPANFAECGQAPFTVYRNQRFIHYTRQLDINDGTRDGLATRLAQGRAEIKELISILRCQNFSGTLTIGGGALYPATAREAVDDFTRLLDTM